MLSVHFLISIFSSSINLMLPSSLLGDNNMDGRSSTTTSTDESFAQLRLPLMPQHATITEFSREFNEYHDLRAPVVTESIPLEDLVNTGPDPECLSTPTFNMTLFPSIRHPRTIDDTINPHQRIPKLIHMTGKSRCITEMVRANLKYWEALPGYTIYFHDDAAVDRLLSKYWPHFPHLSLAQHCSISGAAKADIWRYLVLWEYGGLYTGT
jgi:mannosyltransferase OCH1-like enzyme